jgi:hypothetical protein
MQAIVLPIQLTPLHWILAYASALIYVLLKINELNQNKDYKFGTYIKQHWASSLATAIMIPVALIVLADNFPDILPINNITACLCGWQTNSMFRTLMSAGKNKFIKENEGKNELA